ncbi:MAG: hypothetical protein HY692_01070 [Cyanobacteria bacterium NC_groundwater_1444_Ag_S-0.65um_54_12]|nr:hypothetical protein [Cyanobacteria bacterium NC_groundwater_1444_Ag_S-0.65um_54_12]
MSTVLKTCYINIVGHWNVAIFTPEWLVSKIFDTSQIQLQFSPLPGIWPRFTGRDVTIMPSPDRLIVEPASLSDDLLTLSSNMAEKILEMLSHTPISAIGFNFLYEHSNPDAELLRRFQDLDTKLLGEAGFDVERRQTVKQIRQEHGVLNLKTILDDQSILFEFNFHQNIKSNEEALAAIRHNMVQYRDKVAQILTESYCLVLEGRNENIESATR